MTINLEVSLTVSKTLTFVVDTDLPLPNVKDFGVAVCVVAPLSISCATRCWPTIAKPLNPVSSIPSYCGYISTWSASNDISSSCGRVSSHSSSSKTTAVVSAVAAGRGFSLVFFGLAVVLVAAIAVGVVVDFIGNFCFPQFRHEVFLSSLSRLNIQL